MGTLQSKIANRIGRKGLELRSHLLSSQIVMNPPHEHTSVENREQNQNKKVGILDY